jgi:pilus assembly protein Flp/PilA
MIGKKGGVVMALWQWLLAHPSISIRARGQGLVEYALLLIFVAVVLIALLVILGPGITNVYENIIRNL